MIRKYPVTVQFYQRSCRGKDKLTISQNRGEKRNNQSSCQNKTKRIQYMEVETDINLTKTNRNPSEIRLKQ